MYVFIAFLAYPSLFVVALSSLGGFRRLEIQENTVTQYREEQNILRRYICQHPNLGRRWKVMETVTRDVLAKNQVA